MRRFGFSLALALALSTGPLALASEKPAKAQPGVGFGDRHDTKGASALREMAQCVVKFAPESASRVLATRPRSTQEAYVMRSVTGRFSKCFPTGIASLTLSYMELRGYLAESLYLSENPTDPDYSQLRHGEVPWPAEWLTASKQVNNLLEVYMLQFGSCVAATDPKGVAELLRTEVRSKDERAAIARLKPSLGSCLDNGRTFQLDAAVLRALTAQGLNRGVKEWLKPSLAANDPQKARD